MLLAQLLHDISSPIGTLFMGLSMLEAPEKDVYKDLMHNSQRKLQIMLDYFKCMATPAIQTEHVFSVTKKYLTEVAELSLGTFEIKAPLTPQLSHLILTALFWLSKIHPKGSKMAMQHIQNHQLRITFDNKACTSHSHDQILQHLRQEKAFSLTSIPQGWLYTFDLQ